MGLNLEALGKKVSRYRSQLELSVEALANATGIEHDRIREIESGLAEPTGDEVLVIADVFRCDYRFFISNEQVAPFEKTEEIYRRHGAHFSPEDRLHVQDFLYLCECEEYLQRELKKKDAQEPFFFRKTGKHFKTHGEEAAEKLRHHLEYSKFQVPINVFDDFRRLGIHVFRRKLGSSNISGLFVKHPIAGKCVLVNYSEDAYRQRFTAAHECGHTILDDEEDVVVSFANWNRSDLVEIRANTFASRYLLPPEFLRSIPEATRWLETKVLEWSAKLKVSVEALSIALKEADLIDEATQRWMRRIRLPIDSKRDPELPSTLSTRGLERKKYLLSRGLSDSYVDLCFEAYNEGVISRGRLAECLLIEDAELPEVAEVYGRSLAHGD